MTFLVVTSFGPLKKKKILGKKEQLTAFNSVQSVLILNGLL